MKQLIVIALVLAAIFGSTFLIMASYGVLTVESVKQLLFQLSEIDKGLLFLSVVLLLFADLVVAVPTMSICLLAGFFLGFPLGFASALAGTLSAGIAGFWLSKLYGRSLLRKIYPDREKLYEMECLFETKGAVVILLCRAVPMLPEISCCLAGATNMSFTRFLLLFTISTAPYAFVTSLAGSYSTVENPKPALYVAIAISVTLWGAWYVFYRSAKVKAV